MPSMMKKEISEKIKQLILLSFENNSFDSIRYSRFFTENGSEGTSYSVKNGVETGLKPHGELSEILTIYFKSVKDNIWERFNKFLFEVYADGSYTASYLWDEELIKTQQLKTSRVIPQMVNDQMISWLWEIGYKTKWKNAIFSFFIKNQEVIFEGFFVDKGIQKTIPEVPPQCIKDIIFTDYQMTNYGLLKDVWGKPWNKLVIRCPHNDLNLDKDVDYILEENA